jgi:hypothetical protein
VSTVSAAPKPPRLWERRFLLAFALVGLNCCGAPSCFFVADVTREEFHVRWIENGYPRVAAGDPPARVWRIDWPGNEGGIHYAWSNWSNDEVRMMVESVEVDFPNRAPEAVHDPGCPADECVSSVRIGGFLCGRSMFGAFTTGHEPCSLRVWEGNSGERGCAIEIRDGLAPNPSLNLGLPGMKQAKTTEVRPEKCPADFRWDPGR